MQLTMQHNLQIFTEDDIISGLHYIKVRWLDTVHFVTVIYLYNVTSDLHVWSWCTEGDIKLDLKPPKFKPVGMLTTKIVFFFLNTWPYFIDCKKRLFYFLHYTFWLFNVWVHTSLSTVLVTIICASRLFWIKNIFEIFPRCV